MAQYWLKKFCKGDESLKDDGCSGWPLEVDNNHLRGSLKLILIQLHKKLPKNSGSTILWSAGIWSKLERWKSLISGMPHELTANQNNCHFEVLSSHSVQQQIISWLDCDLWWKVDFIWQPTMTSSVIGPRRSSRALPKAKIAPKKRVMVTVWWSAAPLIHYSSLNPGETVTSENLVQQVNEMLWRLQQLQQYWSTGRAQFSSTTTLDCTSHNQCFKSWATKVPILTNKDVFEPTYNDLKFMIRNHNHVCTNLIQMKIKWRYVCPLAYIMLLCFTLLCLQIVSFLQTEGLWQLYLEEVYWCQVCQLHVLTSCLCVTFW